MNRPHIHTQRLCLRPFAETDIFDIVRLADDPQVSQMTRNIPHPYATSDAENWLDSMQQHANNSCVYAITHLQTGILIGAIGLEGLQQTWPELGYWIGSPFWGEGFCTEAAQALLYYAFTRLSIGHITACHLKENVASGRVMQKLGMRYCREAMLENDPGQPLCCYYQHTAESFHIEQKPNIVMG
ncbi:hypothetical protein VST7929_03200 [Vibrio stylophorae]|uniref:N-acetyltransferase domain-containing protein n=1 Tax=Vibrio stylophorae TaxID=659351 RepID=A0ABN8DW70_9VIBR|nr:GNAT family N-acetyltransferase [Vibrio stylophorae]CAH0535726.1 hypothetical protein VST7929_03200 [Vibrio stylophorae]